MAGNEEADRRAELEAEMGGRMHMPDTATPVGIKQAYPVHLKWSRQAKGIDVMVTDKGPQRQWVREIGKTDDPRCVCNEWTAEPPIWCRCRLAARVMRGRLAAWQGPLERAPRTVT